MYTRSGLDDRVIGAFLLRTVGQTFVTCQNAGTKRVTGIRKFATNSELLVLGRCFPKNLFPVLKDRSERAFRSPETEKPPPSLSSLVFGARTLVTELLEDLIRTWKVIIVCLILAAFASFLWIVLLRLCTCVMVYFTLIVFMALFALATGFCFWRYAVLKKPTSQPPPFYLTLDITIYFRYSTTWLIL
ncbi:unnamed protein product, partial [Rodentolepis nana]|uniref:Uncharacterized protein n=1 Tax=Rodentolepis nana TaxID=102285 RepID=A0A0R3TU08_RODNA